MSNVIPPSRQRGLVIVAAALVLPHIEAVHYTASELAAIMRKAGGLLLRAHNNAPHQKVEAITSDMIYMRGASGNTGGLLITSLRDAPCGWQLSRDLGRTWERAVRYVEPTSGAQVRVFRGV
jgi:hypothetical protein